jgi:hypothetical protein
VPSNRKNLLWFDAKWPVLLSGVSAFVVTLVYDWRFGLAAGVLLVVLGLVWELVAMWFGTDFRGKPSPVTVVSQRYEENLRRRLLAETRARESAAKLRSGPQQISDRP